MICGCYKDHCPPSSLFVWRPWLGEQCLEMVTAGGGGHLAMTGINETSMGDDITKLCGRGKWERRITRYSLSRLLFRRAEREHTCTYRQPDDWHSQQLRPEWRHGQLGHLICGVWDSHYSQWRQVYGKKRHLPGCLFVSCGVSLRRRTQSVEKKV